jgi:hypothetical protein
MDTAQARPEFSVGGIFRDWGGEYRRTHAVSTSQARAMEALAACRTAALGGHLEECDGCGFERPAYNSCGNRHCPQCQGKLARRWLKRQMADLLPAGFRKIRFYGLLAGKGKAQRPAACRRLLGTAALAPALAASPSADSATDEEGGHTAPVCPRCGGKMVRRALLPAAGCRGKGAAPGPALCTAGTGPPEVRHAA